MVFVKVRETYDLHTKQNKMTVIGIHTPKADIIKRNYPGLLMQCRAYRPVSCDVRLACASVLPLDPLGVGTSEGSVAPEDVFNPILYKAMSNKGMSQLEARINMMRAAGIGGVDIDGQIASVDTDDVTGLSDEFSLYYGLLSETNQWKHANPQSGLQMNNLVPYVYEMNYNVGDMGTGLPENAEASYTAPNNIGGGNATTVPLERIIGKAKPFPFLNCTSYSYNGSQEGGPGDTEAQAGFAGSNMPYNAEQIVPYLHTYVAAIIVPPSKRHELFFRMVCEWTLEFTAIRSVTEIVNWYGLQVAGSTSHYINYSYSKVKEALTGDDRTILDGDSSMVSANVDVDKVM